MPEVKRKNARQIMDAWDKMHSDRSHWETHWSDVTYYCIPHKENFFGKRTPGSKLPGDLYDSIQILGPQVFAAGMQGYFTNPASRWFELGMRERAFREIKEVKVWLQIAEEETFDALNESNFNQEIHEVYQDLGVIGTADLYEEEDPVSDVRFYANSMDEICIAEDKHGRVDTVYRKYRITAKQAYERWGNKAGKTAVDAFDKGDFNKRVWYIHAIEPRYSRDMNKDDSENLPFSSIHVSVDDKRKVHESGYHEFPHFVPRYAKNTGDLYGYSNAMTQLPNIKMLQEMGKAIVKGARKRVNPALVLPHDGYVLPLRTGDGAINYRLRGKSDDKIQELGVNGDINSGRVVQEDYRNMIREGFFMDLFMMLLNNNKDMTIPELQERLSERMLLLGPVLGRIQSELLNPLISRTVNILIRRGRIPPPPEAIDGRDYKITYISPLAKAQRALKIGSVTRWLSYIKEMAEITPQVVDLVQVDRVADRLAEYEGVDPDLVTDQKTLDQFRAVRRQLEDQARQIAALKEAASAAKDIGAAEKAMAGARQ